MEVENAKILHIGEVQSTRSGHKMLNVKMQMPLGEQKTFVVYENSVSSFDLVKLFNRNFFKVGQVVAFNFNTKKESWQFDSIWRLKVRQDVDE